MHDETFTWKISSESVKTQILLRFCKGMFHHKSIVTTDTSRASTNHSVDTITVNGTTLISNTFWWMHIDIKLQHQCAFSKNAELSYFLKKIQQLQNFWQKWYDYCRKIQLVFRKCLLDEQTTRAKVKCSQTTFAGCSLHSNNFANLSVTAFLNNLMRMTVVVNSCILLDLHRDSQMRKRKILFLGIAIDAIWSFPWN